MKMGNLLILGFALVCSALGTAAQRAGGSSEEGAIRNVTADYVAALSGADRAVLERVFLPKATITGMWTDPQKGVQLETLSVPDFLAWLEGVQQRFEYMHFSVVKSEVRQYKDMAHVRLVLEVREKEKGKPEEVLHSLDQLHLFRHNGQWRIAGLAWTMEAPDAPLAKLRLR